MPYQIKLVFTVAAIILLPLILWSIRPSQMKPVDPKWFSLGKKDPFFFGTFKSDGTPRKFTWVAVLLIFFIFILFIWTGL